VVYAFLNGEEENFEWAGEWGEGFYPPFRPKAGEKGGAPAEWFQKPKANHKEHKGCTKDTKERRRTPAREHRRRSRRGLCGGFI
jgi:hypothetical protein